MTKRLMLTHLKEDLVRNNTFDKSLQRIAGFAKKTEHIDPPYEGL